MYSLTIIRLCWVTNQFQGTEYHGIAFKDFIIELLHKYGVNDIESFLTTEDFRNPYRIEDINNTIHLFYITKFK